MASRNWQVRPKVVILTPFERLVLEWMVTGFSQVVIARKLEVKQHTISNTTRSIYNKLGCENRVDAVLFALHSKLVESPVFPFYGS